MRLTGRSKEAVELAEVYSKEQGLFRTDETPEPVFNAVLDFDLSTIEPSVAGPRRPQDRVALRGVRKVFRDAFSPKFAGHLDDFEEEIEIERLEEEAGLPNRGGANVESRRAAACPCDATRWIDRNRRWRGAGDTSSWLGRDRRDHLLHQHLQPIGDDRRRAARQESRRARARCAGLCEDQSCSRLPGGDALSRTGRLLPYLDALGFQTVGYGCTTCIGNSGPLPQTVADAIDENELVVAAVLSGNRNFEGRIHPQVRASFLASPPLVVAYALAGSVDTDLDHDPLGIRSERRPGLSCATSGRPRKKSRPRSRRVSIQRCSPRNTHASLRG